MTMQSATSIGRALYRIVFRRGSPQRIHYANANLLIGIAGFLVFSATSLRFFFRQSYLEIGLFLFLSLSGIYIAAALLTRRTPRARLRLTLQAVMLILACAGALLTLSAPLTQMLPGTAWPLGLLIVGCALLGITNCVQFALASSWVKAATMSGTFALLTAALFSILRNLLQTLYG